MENTVWHTVPTLTHWAESWEHVTYESLCINSPTTLQRIQLVKNFLKCYLMYCIASQLIISNPLITSNFYSLIEFCAELRSKVVSGGL